jgi:hypothetical protein
MARPDSAAHSARAPGKSADCSAGRVGLRALLLLISALGLLVALPALAAANPITDENALAGSSGWERPQADTPNIEGYTSKVSAAPGETIGFHVSTNPVVNFRIIVYRLGWYNGAGARQMTCLPSCSTSFTGAARTKPNPNSVTGKVDANWPQTTSLTLPSNWTSGEYVAEYVPTSGSNSGNTSYSPFVVRSSAPQAQASNLLVVVPVNTYQAYNQWGGTSAYDNLVKHSVFALDHATKVSFNRPYHRREWRYWDLPLLRFLEREGYDVSYTTDTDVDANPNILLQHRAVLVSGHSEYWTKGMRDGFEAARDAGTNIAFLGANDAYWQVRYEDSSCPSDNTVCPGTPGPGDRRTMVIYKQEGNDGTDPVTDPSLRTIQWRDLGRPECELQGGVQYGSWFQNDGYRNYTVTAAGAADPWSSGTGFTQGSTITGLVGFEYDSFFPDCDPPGTATMLFTYQGPETSATFDAAAVRYTAQASGARVFSSGSMQFAWGLDSYRWDPTLFTGIPPTIPAVQQFTRNLLADMADPAAPASMSATNSSGTIQIDTTPRNDTRITSYKVYRHAGTGVFQPGDPGVTAVCQNASGDCSDSPLGGTYRYASVAVDQWNDSSAALSGAVTTTAVSAVSDSATVAEDAAATSIDVLANDTPPGGTKTISAVTQPAHGQVVLTGGGSGLTYQPGANYCGPDRFTYTLNGGSSASVSVTVNCVDDPPTAVDDTATVTEDASAAAIAVLGNDTDGDGGPKTVSSVTQAAHGTVVRNADGSGLTYQPSANYCGADSFTYTVNGGSSGTVWVTVTCVDDPPTASNDSLVVIEDASATAIAVLSNDTDVDGGTKIVNSVTQPGQGAVVRNGDGTGLTYQPNADYCGPDIFTYTLNGGSSGTVSVTVTCVDDPPTAVPDQGAVNITVDSGSVTLNVLANDTDNDGGPKSVASINLQPAHGAGSVAGGGTGVTYQLDAHYCDDAPPSSPDSFQYVLNGGSAARVSMTIDCTAPPTAVDDTPSPVAQDASATAIPVLANDANDGGPMFIGSRTQAANGTVLITGGGTGLTYQPNPGYCSTLTGSTDDFTYTLNGGSKATVFMSVTCAGVLVPGAAHGQVLAAPPVSKCKKGFKRVKGKCRKKKRRRK